MTQAKRTPKMVFADNPEGGLDMSHYNHLSIEEREKLYLMRGQGMSLRRIAEVLGRASSTISRELKRNCSKRHPYSPSKAQKYYYRRRTLCGRKHILSAPEKRERVRRLIQEAYWSPEEISNRLRLEGDALRLSCVSIYRAINAGLFDTNKRMAGRSRKMRFAYHLRRKGKKKHAKGDANRQGQHYRTASKIADRPAEAANRTEIGHFEADTVIGKRGGECLVSLVDRKSRLTLALKMPDGSAKTTRDAMIELLGRLPSDKLKSITPDRGAEFALYQDVSAAFDNIPFYFADPHSPWQRGTNENTNGLIREYLPKGFDMACVSDEDIAGFITLLNLRPRKCLGWRSPFEVFFSLLLHLS